MLLINDNTTLVRANPLPRLKQNRCPAPQLAAPQLAPRELVQPRSSVRRVALLVESSGSYGRGLLQGIARYNRERGNWSTYFRPQGLNGPLPTWLRRWDGDGMLVRVDAPETIEWARKSKLPIVSLRSSLAKLPFPNLSVDNRQIAQLALDHLHERGLRNFAFCGRREGLNPALDDRREQFCDLVELRGSTCHCFDPGRAAAVDWDEEQDRLVRWILSLPKPLGIMACNDERGHEVLEACRRANVCVPEDVAVIGVDNDQAICDLAIQSLTSVDVNAEGIGYEAAALLDRMMSGEKPSARLIKLAPRGVVTRRSTDLVASEDQEAGRALRFIRENACRGLQVAGVLSYMAMSRASLQQRVKHVSGRTIHQEIQRVRLARVKDLLAMSDMTIKQVARESGFASVQYMTRVFRMLTGETPARYRILRSK